MKSSGDILPISEVAKRSGVAASALRFYEEKGLITSTRAVSSGHRRYERQVLRRIAFIVFAQRVGLSLDEIAGELKKLPRDATPGRAEWSKLTTAWRKRIDEQLEQLQRMRETLTECIGCGCLSLSRCRFANPQDRMASRGSGPRFWQGDAARAPSPPWG